MEDLEAVFKRLTGNRLIQKLTAEDEHFMQCREDEVRQGQAGSLQIGRALVDIHDYKDGILYAERHGTFDRYCREVFQIGRSYAYAMMEAARLHKQLSAQADRDGLTIP